MVVCILSGRPASGFEDYRRHCYIGQLSGYPRKIRRYLAADQVEYYVMPLLMPHRSARCPMTSEQASSRV